MAQLYLLVIHQTSYQNTQQILDMASVYCYSQAVTTTKRITSLYRKALLMTIHHAIQTNEFQELIQRAQALRKEFAKTSAEVDARGEDPTENLQLIGKAGLNRLSIPVEYGGLWDRKMNSNSAALIEIATHLCAGEGSTGMIFVTQTGGLRLLFHEQSDLPEAIQKQLAREILEEDARFVGSHADTGTGGQVTSRKVDGGIIINGTKTFNTGSGSARYAHVMHTLEGVGLYSGLVRLDDPGVTLHHDWDNMGQRATVSQTITYKDVFVPDGWHMPITGFTPLFLTFMWLLYASITLGNGEGGYDAMLDYVRTSKRSITPGWEDARTDPIIRLRIGEFSSRLAAAHALLREVSQQLEQLEEGADFTPVLVGSMRAQAACIDAAVKTTSEIFELTGARSTANTYRLDRFWRNARTFSLHDPIEAKLTMLGNYDLTGEFIMPTPPQSKQ
jgi:alkylation response protein AidB-like acyl-CoA dehydrogenase